MDYCISEPSPALSQLVRHYWAMENSLPAGIEHYQRIVPSGLTELTFYFDSIPESQDTVISIDGQTVVTGQLNYFYDLKVTRKLSLFSVIFQPLGLVRILNIPANELFNRNVPLKYILKDQSAELEARLYAAATFQERIRITEQFLLQCLNKDESKDPFRRIQHVVRLINQAKGLIDIDTMASEACLSRKQFERTFTGMIGTTPKQFIKTVRFQNAIHERSMHREENLTTLAYKCGYYDQSHMINDFVRLSGMTPKDYFTECEPFSDYFH